MPDTRYAFMSAYLKGEEARIVALSHIDGMSKATSLNDALAMIAGTDIGDYFQELPIRTFDDLDEGLWRYFREYLARLQALKLLPADMLKILRAHLVKYDIFNIKAALHRTPTGKKATMIPMGIIHSRGLLDELSGTENTDGIMNVLVNCKLANYGYALRDYVVDEEPKPKLLAENRLDEEYYRSYLDIAKDIKEGLILAKAISLTVDLKNLQIASRAIILGIGSGAAGYIVSGGYMLSPEAVRELLSGELTDVSGSLRNTPYYDVAEEIATIYNRTQSVTSVDETIDRYKFRFVKELLSPRILSPLVMAWHLTVKEIEIRNLRLVLKALLDNMPLEDIKHRLVALS
ncbi:MAG: V-type ATPase subunit [Chloroflexi bacterium]|nr:V-type ATPase subunit [Chloroflexota bacterium]